MTDVVIIGAGVVGCLAARALSRFQIDVLLLDKAHDVAEGSSKANSGIIHAGYDAKPNSLRAKLNVSGNELIKSLANELFIDYSNNGSMVIAFEDEQVNHLKELYQRGIRNNVPDMEIITSKEKIHAMEPELSGEVVGALYAPTAGIICPWGLAIAACENAVENGVKLKLGTEVLSISKQSDGFIVHTNRGSFETHYIINAAGIYSDNISSMVEEKWFSIKPIRGEYLLLDKRASHLTTKTLFGTPGPLGKGIVVTPTVHGNLLLGPTSVEQIAKDDVDNTCEGIEAVFNKAKSYIPSLHKRDVITTFTGLRDTPDKDDFIIGASKQVRRFINAAGIDSPGLTASPAIAEMIIDILKEEGLNLVTKSTYNPIRKQVTSFSSLSEHEKASLIGKNPLYGHIICRCETITEGEIIDAIRRPVGAKNLDAIKRRVRAGMGRCQGSFCTPRITEILSRELGVLPEQVTKKGGDSRILVEKLNKGGGNSYDS